MADLQISHRTARVEALGERWNRLRSGQFCRKTLNKSLGVLFAAVQLLDVFRSVLFYLDCGCVMLMA